MDSWIIWLILAAALGVAEIFTLTAALGIISVAALLTAGVAAIGLPPGLQLLVFVLVWFQPHKLVIDDTVSEPLPGLDPAAVQANGGPPAVVPPATRSCSGLCRGWAAREFRARSVPWSLSRGPDNPPRRDPHVERTAVIGEVVVVHAPVETPRRGDGPR